ncbi:MAG: glycosyltransferase family 4 protein [Actinobacteria bacterium]|nr:MAG: glycosyltransferase family 4 protein [Actinomycetota bacterium]
MEPDHTQSDSAQSGETQLEGTQSGDTADLTFSGVGPDTAPASADASRAALAEMAARAGLRRVHMLAWRDLYDPEAGGSEVHASTVAKLWAEAGIEVTMRSSYAQGHPPVGTRDGYHVIRKAGRYMVFPRAAVSELRNKYGPRDGLVEIWNGMPFLSPLWAIGPRIVFLHHLHGEMWKMTLPPNLARMGEILEYRVAPPLYRRTRIVTLSYSSRDELVHEGFRPDLVSVVPPGIDPRFSPGGERSATPLVVAVGRLVPVKRYDLLIKAVGEVRDRHPALELVIVGEGYEKPALDELVASMDAKSWVRFAGHVDDDALIDLYRRAWLLVSASAREGWGMTITEAAACGTPAAVTRIAGHLDAVDDEHTGLLADDPRQLVEHIDALIGDDVFRQRLSKGALAHAARFTWAATAHGTLEVLAADAMRRRSRRG